MRLVDIDKFNKLYFSSYDCSDRAGLLEMCTVKAIPIEWIKDYITPFQVFHDSLSEELQENDGPGWVVEVLQTMLREWEKENEID